MQRVLEHVQCCPDGDLTVEGLSRVAFTSRFHFHRQFSAFFGITVFRYVRLVRMKRAAYRLAFRPNESIIDISLGAGFDAPESFSRAFRKTFGSSPSQFRRGPRRGPWREPMQPTPRMKQMTAGKHDGQVRIVQFGDTRVAALEHRGGAEEIDEALRTFIEWRKRYGRPPGQSETYNIVYPPDDQGQWPMDICATVPKPVAPNRYGVVNKVIPGGRYAVLRHLGCDENIEESFDYLYGEWLPGSGESLRDSPVFFHRVNLFPDVPESQLVTDIYLPLR